MIEDEGGSRTVHDVMEELTNQHYLGGISSIVSVTINSHNELELRLALNRANTYALISGLELLKQKLVNDLIENAAVAPRRRDI